MASLQGSETREEVLNDSWVELHFQQNRTPPNDNQGMFKSISVSNTQMEKLLLEAQRESSSRTSSRGGSQLSSHVGSNPSSRGSPRSPHSPVTEMAPTVPAHTLGLGEISTLQDCKGLREEGNNDWIWDWSSRPEVAPPSEWSGRFKHPSRHKLSVRNTRVMRAGPFSLENLPALLFTHACTFFLGAAAMLFYLKKYCNWATVARQTIN
ncbi:BCL2/adenovirus E1B 19 kDa protein-interacting protein 3 [Lamellibrachia satsuma]|nr:BCL2/adenovirus E1B 19 kDa protein-interacting protein 3 [Lamellibrachia satsuma]